jgi:hypothetical protein
VHPQPSKDTRKEPVTPPPAHYFCDSTKPDGYPTLTQVQRTDGNIEFFGQIIGWTPNDNATACYIRQILFNVPDVMGKIGSGPAAVSPDILVQLRPHGSKNGTAIILNYDIVTEQNGPCILYRIDAQAYKSDGYTLNLRGDYDFYIDIVGRPKP